VRLRHLSVYGMYGRDALLRAAAREAQLRASLMCLRAALRAPRLPIAHRAISRRERDRTIDLLLRDSARRSLASAPSRLTSAVRVTLAHTTMTPVVRPAPASLIDRMTAARAWLTANVLAALVATPWVAAHLGSLTERQRRAALRSVTTLVAALLAAALGLVLDPSVVFTLLGVISAFALSSLVMSHLLAAAVGAVMGSAMLGLAVLALFAVLAALWIRLVRHPVEV
jgi:hypothetical protein